MGNNQSVTTKVEQLKRKEKDRINDFLVNELYEKELKFTRSAEEIDCISKAVKTIVEKLMILVGNDEPVFEIAHQFLVGSMAEGTSIREPSEYDFLVVFKHFSIPGAIGRSVLFEDGLSYRKVYALNKEILSTMTAKSKYLINDYTKEVLFKDRILSSMLNDVIPLNLESLFVETNKGKVFIKSTTICHHGPASVIKLRWEPTSENSKPLDILVDITPCIEQHGIARVISANEVAIPYHYEALIRDDTFMLTFFVGTPSEDKNESVFVPTYTTTEIKLVKSLSSHHRLCYMILKYCLNSILYQDITDKYITPFPSYRIKTFVLRHSASCSLSLMDHLDNDKCIFTCLLDIMNILKEYFNQNFCRTEGIFGEHTIIMSARLLLDEEALVNLIDNVIDKLLHIGKARCSVSSSHEEFKKACQRTSTHPAVQSLADELAQINQDCHIPVECLFHQSGFY